ncbi:MAG: F0F1 ATP synthase subunit epsilon [Chloroflexi bacterium]|nr:F0F1 ATP synthase subunit epsilon [Chloroflexota bacterium]
MPITLEVVTAERVVFSDHVDSVVLPGVEGELGVLPSHTPLMTLLHLGELRARKGQDQIILAINGGFLEVLPDRVVVLADTAERVEEIDEARAEEARQRSLQRIAEARAGVAEVDLQQAVIALRRSQLRLKVARRRRERKG